VPEAHNPRITNPPDSFRVASFYQFYAYENIQKWSLIDHSRQERGSQNTLTAKREGQELAFRWRMYVWRPVAGSQGSKTLTQKFCCYLGKIKIGVFACFFRAKPTVLGVLVGFADQ
jgi:hypothetical protein